MEVVVLQTQGFSAFLLRICQRKSHVHSKNPEFAIFLINKKFGKNLEFTRDHFVGGISFRFK